MPNSIANLSAKGLNFSPNNLTLPDGSLLTAENVIINRDNVIQSRRGYKLWGTSFGAPNTLLKQIISYKGVLLRHFNTSLEYQDGVNNAGVDKFSLFSGSYTEQSTGLRIKSIEANKNLYFTTSEGVKKISARTASDFTTAPGFITNAGGVKSIDFTAAPLIELGNQTGFLPQDSAVAYRTVWATKDLNNNLILGSPSSRVEVYNPLSELIVRDTLRVCGALDDITDTTTTARIADGNYVNTFSSELQLNASGSTLKNVLLDLAKKIDEDILYGQVAAGSPLVISQTQVTSNVATVTFSSGNPQDFFLPGSNINLRDFDSASAVLNGSHIITSVTATTIVFNFTTPNYGPDVPTIGNLESYEYRYAVSNIPYNGSTQNLYTLVVDTPATNDQLSIIQAGLDGIILRLQEEPPVGSLVGVVISSSNQTNFIQPLDITTTANVKLKVSIPDDITPVYFLQLYRSGITTATQVTSINDLSPNDEMQLVLEVFPSSAELTAKEMTIIDETPEEFRGANLYTNPSSGEGILQANDVPPFAVDINTFKGSTFYANTRTRQRLNMSLLGVQTLIDEYNADPSNPPAIIITDGTTTNTYTFIVGVNEVTDLTVPAKAAVPASGYFDLNSANNTNQYRFWYDTTGSDVAPSSGGRTLVKILIANLTTATEVAAKTRDIINLTPEDFSASASLAVTTITNTQEGPATDLLLGPGMAGAGFSSTVVTQGVGEDISAKQILLSSVVSPAQAVQLTVESLIRVVNQNTGNVYTYYTSAASDVPGKFLIEGRGLSVNPFYVVLSSVNGGALFSPTISPDQSIYAAGAITVANPTVLTVPGHGYSNNDQVIILNSNSTPSIDGIHTITVINANSFSIPVNVTAVPAIARFSVINKSNAELSENEAKANRVYYSKTNQPEAVPILNYFNVGSEDSAILRIYPLRDSLFVFKEDGLYRISGESIPFSLQLFDGSVKLLAPDSISLLNGLIYGWESQGIISVSESGNEVISRPIDTKILKVASHKFVNFFTATFGIGYDSDNSYTVWTVDSQDDTIATKAHRYCILTESWTTYDKTNTCGITNSVDDLMYLGAGDTNYIEQERKNFDRSDYADREYSVILPNNNYNGNSLRLNTVVDIKDGDVLVQEQYLGIYDYNALLNKLDLDVTVGVVNVTSIPVTPAGLITIVNTGNNNLSAGDTVKVYNTNSVPQISGLYEVVSATPTTFTIEITEDILVAGTSGKARLNYHSTLQAIAGDNMRDKLVELATKLDGDPGVNFTDYLDRISSKSGSITAIAINTNPVLVTTSAPHELLSGGSGGSTYGRIIAIALSNSTPNIDGTFQITGAPQSTFLTNNTFNIPLTVTTAGTSGSYSTQDDDLRDQKACFNIIIDRLNADSGVTFNNYGLIDKSTLQEMTVLNVDYDTNIVTTIETLPLVVGDLTVYSSIPCEVIYAPSIFGDPLSLKQIREATAMFESKSFSGASLAFSSDLMPEFIEIPFNADGKGLFGHFNFGTGNYFGGTGNSAPFRTYIPRQVQRCRYINVKFKHNAAREIWYLYGITLTGETPQSTRAYR